MNEIGHSLPTRQRATHLTPLRIFLFLTSTSLLGFFVAGCGSARTGSGGGGNSFNDCGPGTACYTYSCSDVCDSSCSNYSSSPCTASGSGPTDTGTTGTTAGGGCTDAADPSCGNYDPTGFDGGGTGDGGCDPSTCGDPGTGGDTGVGTGGDTGSGGDTGVGSGDTGTGGDTGVGDGGGDTGGGGDGGGGDGGGGDGGDGGGGIARTGGGQRLAPRPGHVPSETSSAAFSKLMVDRLPALPNAKRKGEQQ